MSIMNPTLSGLRRHATRVATGAALLVSALVSSAATLSFDAALHIQPEEDAPVVGTVPAGTAIQSMLRPDLEAAGVATPPPGWIAIRHAGPFNGFVRNREVQEDGSVRPGAEIRAQPLPDAPLLLIVEEGDEAKASEPMGDWSRATIRTDLIVFVHAVPPVSRSLVPEAEGEPAADAATLDAEGDGAPETATAPDPEPKRERVRKPKRERAPREPKVDPTPVVTEATPRTFEGYLMRNRKLFGRPKYDYQLVDESNKRIAFLDLSSLSSAAQLDALESRRVSVYGPGLSRPDVRDLIIRVETLRLLE